MDLQLSLYNRGLISRPIGSQLGEKEPSIPTKDLQLIHILASATYPVVGVDVSYWQQTIDWSKLATKVHFVFLRAGRGNADRDTFYPSYLANAHSKGRAVGIYWYMKPNTGSNWKQHMASFIPIYKDSGSQLPPVFDVEETALDKTVTTGWIDKAAREFESQTNVSPMIYTSPGFWNANTYRNDWAKQLALWVANWTTASAPSMPDDWVKINNPKTWEFWQYSSKGDGKAHGASSTYIDLDRFNGSLASFNLKYKMDLKPLEDVPVPPPPPVPTPKNIYIIGVDEQSVRSTPVIDPATLFARGIKNKEVEVLDDVPQNGYVPVKAWMLQKSLKKK